jgi:dipeptidyl aminopeptidase/acylaminoacyl peptidase
MPYPGGKGILFVNGKSSGFLTVYRPRTKVSVDIVLENSTQPTISPDGKRLIYIKIPSQNKMEMWAADIEGGNPLKFMSSGRLTTLGWSQDGSQVAFADNTSGGGKAFLVGSDGRGLRQIEGLEGFVGWLIWSADGKTLYISTTTSDGKEPIFVANADGSHPQKFLDDCCISIHASRDGKRLLSLILNGEDVGVYQVNLSEKSVFRWSRASLLLVVNKRQTSSLWCIRSPPAEKSRFIASSSRARTRSENPKLLSNSRLLSRSRTMATRLTFLPIFPRSFTPAPAAKPTSTCSASPNSSSCV